MITVHFRRSSNVKNDKSANLRLARKLERELKRFTPVRTGRLRRGWEISIVNGRSFTLENSVYYGYWVENGNTIGAKPQRFTRRAVQYFSRKYSVELNDYNDPEMEFIEE
jgi:hypothetical protein